MNWHYLFRLLRIFHSLQPVFKSPRHSFQPHPLSSHHCIHLIHPSTCPALITLGFGCILSLLLGQRQLHWEGICCTLHLSGGCRARRFPDMIDQVSKARNKNNSENPWRGRNSAFQKHQPVSGFAKGIFNLFWLFSNLHLKFQLSSSAIISPPGAGLFDLSRLMGWCEGSNHKICNSHQIFWKCRFESHGLTQKLNSGYTEVPAKLLQKSFSSGAVDFQKDGEENKNPSKSFYLMHISREKSSWGPLVMRQSQLGRSIEADIKVFNNAFSSPFERLQEPSSLQNQTGQVFSLSQIYRNLSGESSMTPPRIKPQSL